MCVNMAMSCVSIIFATILRFYLKSLNRKLDRGQVIEGVNNAEGAARMHAVEEQGLPGIAVERGFRFLV
jgi:hypothetical protein